VPLFDQAENILRELSKGAGQQHGEQCQKCGSRFGYRRRAVPERGGVVIARQAIEPAR